MIRLWVAIIIASSITEPEIWVYVKIAHIWLMDQYCP
jgi:hypothetical protein